MDEIENEYELHPPLLYAQLSCSLPLSKMSQFPLPDYVQTKQQQEIGSAILSASFEISDELLNSEWIESGVDITTLAIDNIFKHILSSLYNSYKSLNVIPNIKQLQRQNYSDFKRFLQDRRGRTLIHYVSRSTNPKVQESFVFYKDDAACTATCVSVSEIGKLVPDAVFILDANFGGNMINRIKATPNAQNAVAFAATQAGQKLPYLTNQSRLCPTDIFSLCMLQPVLALLLGYVQCFQASTGSYEFVTFKEVSGLYDRIVNTPALHQYLYAVFTAVSENVAYSALSKRDFYAFYLNGRNLQVFIRHFLAAQRVMSVFGAHPVCTLEIADASANALWSYFDGLLHAALRLQTDGSFISKQLDAFELQISFAHSKPTNLPIILRMMQDRQYQARGYYLIVKYVDYSPDNLQEALDLGLADILLKKLARACAGQPSQNAARSAADVRPSVFYLVSKCLQHSTEFAAYYVRFQTTASRSLPSTLEIKLFQQIQTAQRPETEIIVRQSILQILTILCSRNLIHSFRNDADFALRTYPFCVRRDLLRDRQGRCIQPLLRLAQSASCQIRVWALLLIAELVGMLPIYTQFTVAQGVPYIEQKRYLELYNQESFQIELQDIIMQLAIILKKDEIPEVRAAAARAIKHCFPDLPFITSFAPPKLGEPVQDMIQNYYDQSIFKALCTKLLYDMSNIVRYDCLLTIIYYIIAKFNSFIYQYAQFLAPQFQKLYHRNVANSYSDKAIQLIISSLEQSAYDPNSYISTLAQSTIKNLKSYAVVILLQQSKLNKEFFTFDQDQLYEQQLAGDEKQAKKYELTQYLFDERELSYVQYLGMSINSLEFRDLQRLLEKNMQEIHSSQFNTDILSFSYRDYMTDIAVSQIHSLYAEQKMVSSANGQLKRTSEPQECSSELSSNDRELLIEGSSSVSDEYEYKSHLTPHLAPQTLRAALPSLSARRDVISQADLQMAQKNQPQEEKQFSRATSIKFEYLREKLIYQQNLDSLFLSIAHCIFANRLYLECLNLCSPIFYIAVQSIEQPKIQSNLQAQAVYLANKSSLVLRGCSQHNQLQIMQTGVFVNRPNDFRCYLCDNICPYGTRTKLSETILKSFSHAFSLSQAYRASLYEQASLQAGTYSYSFVQMLQSCIQLCQLPEEKRQTFYQIYCQAVQEQTHQALPCARLIREISTELCNRYSDQPQRDAVQLFAQHIARRQCDLRCCQSFVFSFPVDSSMQYMVQDGIPLTVFPKLPDAFARARDMPHFQQLSWYQLYDQTYSCSVLGNNCVLQDGDIYMRNNAHWASQKSQQCLYPVLNLLQFLELNKGQGNLTDLQQVMEATDLYVTLDQSCELCRRLAVKVPLLQQIAKTLSKRAKDQKAHVKFIYVPTRDLNPLAADESKAVLFKKKQNASKSSDQQQLIKEFQKHLSAPFPQLDEQFYCDGTVSRRFHSMFGRSLYRIIYAIRDNLFSYYRFANFHAETLSQSLYQLNRIDSQLASIQEFGHINSDLQLISTRDKIALQHFRPSQTCFKSSIAPQSDPPYRVSDVNYRYAVLEPADSTAGSETAANSMFSSQLQYLQKIRHTNSQNDDFMNGKKEIYDAFRFPEAIKFVRFHPILPFFFVGSTSGINVYSVTSRTGINVISAGVMDDYQNNQLYESAAAHQHYTFPTSLRPLHSLVNANTRYMQPVYAAYLTDYETLAQHCPVCRSIAVANDFDSYMRNYDLYDKQCARTFDQMSKYQNYEVGDLSQFFGSDAPSAKFYNQRITPWEPFDISYINAESTYYLLGVSCTDGCYRILSNPFDINTTRYVASFRVLQQSQQFPYDVLEVLPVFDMMGRMHATQQQRSQQNTYFHYIKSRLQTCALEMQESIGQASWQSTFLTNVLDTNAVFASDSLKVVDMVREVEVFDPVKMPGICTALAQNDSQIAVAHSGFLQIVDKRAGRIVHSENNPVDHLQYHGSELIQAYQNGSIVRSQYKLQYKGPFTQILANFAVSENGNLCHLFKQKEYKIKLDGNQVVYCRDGRMCCTYDADRMVRLYSVM